jgi:hypothetical protein
VATVTTSAGDFAVAFRGLTAGGDGDFPDVPGGVAWSAATGTWTSFGNPPMPSFDVDVRDQLAAWSANGRFYVWGGQRFAFSPTSLTYPSDGASWDPITNTWAAMPGGGPTGRASALVVFTGCDAIVYGGSTGTGLANDGALFRP